MPQAIWTGSISFGLVTVPIRLYPATRRKDVRFHELDRLTGQRVRHQRVRLTEAPASAFDRADRTPLRRELERESRSPLSPPAPRLPARPMTQPSEVVREDVVKGFEVSPDQYVTVSAAEIEELAPGKSRTLEVEQFASASDVDPVYFDASYYVLPTQDGIRPFRLLREAMSHTDKLALGWFTLRSKRHLAAVRAHGEAMLLSTMLHADEVLPAPALLARDARPLTEREQGMARLLVDTLSGPFEPERYRDEYRERILDLVRRRTPEPSVRSEPAGAAPEGVQDLMAALQASIEAAKAARPESGPAIRRKAGEGA